MGVGEVLLKMFDILLIFQTDILEEIGVRHQKLVDFHSERLAVAFRIVDRHLNFHVADIATMKTLGYVQRVSMGMAGGIQPASIVEAGGIDDQRVSFPPSSR